MADKTDIWVYADWKGMASPKCIGILSVQQAKGRKAFSFSYNTDWLNSREQIFASTLEKDRFQYSNFQYRRPSEKSWFHSY